MGRRKLTATAVLIARIGAPVAAVLCLANCSKSNIDPKYGVAPSTRVVSAGETVPKGGGTYRVGRPYQVAGRTYVPEENPDYEADGVASWYGDVFHGRLTANGEVFDMNSITAAHPTLPIPSYVRVTNLRNNRSIIVRVNDRGPFHENRVIDVSVRAAKLLDFHQYGITRVKVQYVGRAALEGSDDEKLAATLSNGAPAAFPETRLASRRAPAPSVAAHRPAVRAETVRYQERPHDTSARVARTAPPAAQTVGRAPAAVASASDRAPVQTSQAMAGDGPASFESRFSLGSSSTAAGSAPVSAFAPRFDGIITGRGIY
jgi:rare lipoprotein A